MLASFVPIRPESSNCATRSNIVSSENALYACTRNLPSLPVSVQAIALTGIESSRTGTPSNARRTLGSGTPAEFCRTPRMITDFRDGGQAHMPVGVLHATTMATTHVARSNETRFFAAALIAVRIVTSPVKTCVDSRSRAVHDSRQAEIGSSMDGALVTNNPCRLASRSTRHCQY